MMDKNITTLPERFLTGIATNYNHILISLIKCCHRDEKFIQSFQGNAYTPFEKVWDTSLDSASGSVFRIEEHIQ